MGRQRLRLIVTMALHRPLGAVGTIVLALILVAGCINVSGCITAYGLAVERGAHSSFGRYNSQVTGNDDIAAYMLFLQRQGEAVAISHSHQNFLVSGSDRAADSDVTMTSGPADLSVLKSGRYPQEHGELTISMALAQQLRAELGEHLESVDADQAGKPTPWTVVGITENPASTKEITAIGVSDDDAAVSSSGVWLTNDNLAAITTILSHGGGNVATVDSVMERARANAVSYQAVSPQLAWLFSILFIVALVAAIYAADRQRRRAVYTVLIGLGDTPGQAAFTTCAQTSLLAVGGGLVGWCLGAAVLPGLSSRLATLYEQRWSEVSWSTVTVTAVGILAVILIGGGLTVAFTVLSHKKRARAHTAGFSRRALLAIGVLGTVLTILLVMSRQRLIFPQGHRAAMVVGALSIPALAYGVTLATRKHRVTARLGHRLQKLALAAFAVVFVVNYWGAFYASGVASLTNWLGGQINGEDSYLQINNTNEQAITEVLEKFPEVKPHTALFGDISTKEQMFRITDREGQLCYEKAHTVADCPRSNLDIVYSAAGGLADEKYVGHAPSKFVTDEGAVTIIGIGITDSAIKQVTQLEGIIPDDNLDNNILSGLILPADSPLLQQFGVEKPQSYTAIITGFASLPDEVRDGVRATVLKQAPFAFLSDSDDPEVRQLRAQAVARQLFAIIVSGTLLLALSSTVVSDQRIERRLNDLYGGGWKVSARLLIPLLFSYTVTVVSAVILGRLVAMDRIPFTHLDTAVPHDYGVVWALGLAGLLFLLPAFLMGTRSASTSTPANPSL